MSDGSEIEKNKIYKVAIMKGSVHDDYIESSQDMDILIKDLLRKTIKEKKTISPSSDGRFIIE